ncbi:DUF4062 domain-containing protein [Glycomyces buryatensis]|uniref:DUF4062 domain-containing protein n=1 Tax=Glycomyces buryatensis TaxID=2570927 RepID=A0A4S8QKI1_9ACTN|nr:DUF4062 domain-containing protein [Glycomyces buryatensis]THV41939.1 DUF4062 domain-containing protein [Glycomyces buryatensis]
MAIEKREQVFISSTLQDLKEERQAVIQALLDVDCIPAGMEMFPASDADTFDLIKEVIDLCDYYVVVIGDRYGSVHDKEQISYTEMEFDYAVSQGIPVMGFLHGDPGSIPSGKVDMDPELRVKLESFRAKIQTRIIRYWLNPGDLTGKVIQAIVKARKSHPAVGWIRGSEAMTPEIKSELAELRAKVAELTADLKTEQREHQGTVERSELVQGEDKSHVMCSIEFHWESQLEEAANAYVRKARGSWEFDTTWNELFKRLAPALMDEATEVDMRGKLSTFCLREANRRRTEIRDDVDEEPVGRVYEAKIASQSFDDIKVQFDALGLIENGSKKRLASDTNVYWKLTSEGRHQLTQLRAIRKNLPTDEGSDLKPG